jgi:organic radical activating enzyme
MTEREALEKMIPPSKHRVGKPKGGVIQIWLTRACDKACFGCTQGSNLGGKPGMITVNQFEAACKSLTGYFGIVGVFGGNPALHPKFPEICEIARRYFPKEKLGLWCNHPKGHGKVMAHTFNPAVSTLTDRRTTSSNGTGRCLARSDFTRTRGIAPRTSL